MIAAGVALTVLFVSGVLLLPRSWAALGVIAAVCYITQAQQVVLFGFHFTAIRIVLLAGIFRILARGEFRGCQLNKIDWALIGYTCATTFVPWLRERTSDELVYRLGCAYDILLSYWVFRGLLNNQETIETFLCGLAILIVPLAAEMVLESFTHRSLFEPFGGIGELTIRNGRPRCQGAFRVGITSGIFGATLMPMFVGLFRLSGRRGPAVLGILTTIVITYTSNSSGPLMAFLSGAVAWLFWPWRTNMRMVRRGIVALLVGLHLVMKVPVWFIFSKLGALTGGDGWHRSYLIDRFIHFFPDWWLIGAHDTSDWMPTVLSDGSADLTDLYVAAGVNGGLVCLVLLILLFVRCFRYLGAATAGLRARSSETEFILWGMGAALFAHVVTFFSVTYWDQLHVAWWGFLAMISTVTFHILQTEPAVVVTEEFEDSSSEKKTQNRGLPDGLPEGPLG
jgi:hypothetical protein